MFSDAFEFWQVVSALAVDHSGSRVLSSSYDYTVRMYDFQGMNARLQSFRQMEPSEGHQVRSLSWSPTADRFLCVTGSAQAKIYDRDGLTLGEFVRGDMYIRDLKNTKGKSIAGGVGDGSIQIWNLKPGWGSMPDIYVANTHSDDITGVKFSCDGRILLSRCFDGSLKVWDLHQMKEPLKVFDDLPNNYAQTNIAFSPDEQLFITGISIEKDGTTGGMLCFFDRGKLELVSRVGISPTYSVVQCGWHPRKKSIDDFLAEPVIHNPHALPLFRDQPSRKRQRDKVLKDPLKSHKPEQPITGPGFGGKLGSTKGSLLTQYLFKQGGLIKETWMEEDPREAILKHADATAKDPKFIAPAYADT
ncbi:hypothetical protein RND71_018891 [Anisodus tanguticus]|uniref:Transducin/WD40 repeat-like superfamily protein n=1 Tax=Anisodus tanguticus TaxID=243964 RepID=A0AAE1S5F6_9SOLA|nr:hypothetical protein RND71_018891 [Anisodus tanguticus]